MEQILLLRTSLEALAAEKDALDRDDTENDTKNTVARVKALAQAAEARAETYRVAHPGLDTLPCEKAQAARAKRQAELDVGRAAAEAFRSVAEERQHAPQRARNGRAPAGRGSLEMKLQGSWTSEDERAAAIAAASRREHEEAAAAARLRREEDERAADIAALARREHEEAAAAARVQREEDERAAAVARVVREEDERAAATARRHREEDERAAAAARLQRLCEDERTASRAAAARMENDRAVDAATARKQAELDVTRAAAEAMRATAETPYLTPGEAAGCDELQDALHVDTKALDSSWGDDEPLHLASDWDAASSTRASSNCASSNCTSNASFPGRRPLHLAHREPQGYNLARTIVLSKAAEERATQLKAKQKAR
jgi:hypothetical protein